MLESSGRRNSVAIAYASTVARLVKQPLICTDAVWLILSGVRLDTGSSALVSMTGTSGVAQGGVWRYRARATVMPAPAASMRVFLASPSRPDLMAACREAMGPVV
jgi:hypothetical protein